MSPEPPPFQPKSKEDWVPSGARTPLSRLPKELLPASVAERLSGQKILLVVKPTPKAILAAALPIAVLFLFVLALPLLLGPGADFLFRAPPAPGDDAFQDAIPFLGLLALFEAPFFIILAVLFGRLARNVGLLFTTYVVTEEEVVSHFSFITERISQIPHEKITDVLVTQGFIQRTLGYAELTVEAYTQGANIRMRGVAVPRELLHLLSDRARRATSIRYLLEAD